MTFCPFTFDLSSAGLYICTRPKLAITASPDKVMSNFGLSHVVVSSKKWCMCWSPVQSGSCAGLEYKVVRVLISSTKWFVCWCRVHGGVCAGLEYKVVRVLISSTKWFMCWSWVQSGACADLQYKVVYVLISTTKWSMSWSRVQSGSCAGPQYKVVHVLVLSTYCTELVNGCKYRHDDVIKWKHFPRYWPFERGIHRSRWIPRTKASDAELWCFL